MSTTFWHGRKEKTTRTVSRLVAQSAGQFGTPKDVKFEDGWFLHEIATKVEEAPARPQKMKDV